MVGGGVQDQSREVCELEEGEPEARRQQEALPGSLAVAAPTPLPWGPTAQVGLSCLPRQGPARPGPRTQTSKESGWSVRPCFCANICLLPDKVPAPKEQSRVTLPPGPAPSTTPWSKPLLGSGGSTQTLSWGWGDLPAWLQNAPSQEHARAQNCTLWGMPRETVHQPQGPRVCTRAGVTHTHTDSHRL